MTYRFDDPVWFHVMQAFRQDLVANCGVRPAYLTSWQLARP